MKTWSIGFLCAALACAGLVACGDDPEPNNTTSASSSSSSSGTGGSGGGQGGAGGGQGGAGGGQGGAGGGQGGAGGGGANLLNGCDPTKAVDHTADTMVTVNFGGGVGETYDPPCIRVKTGTQVTFSGSFMFHPLSGGKVEGGIATPDLASPIAPTATGMSAMFTLDAVGEYPYYCTAHYTGGMQGAIFVE
jgi:plastocyanin